MDKYTPLLLENGLRVMIGKGERSKDVTEEISKYDAVYFICVGGISALLAQSVVSCETFCWKELDAEAIYRLVVKDFPCYVAII
jgi:fumarate hydratase subunit beta